MTYDLTLVNDPTRDLCVGSADMETRFVPTMADLDMVYNRGRRPSGYWPDWEQYCPADEQSRTWFDSARVHLEHGEALPDGVPAVALDQARAYLAACDEMRREHPPGGLVIPWHKLMTNDGWIVTPTEVEAALFVYATSDRAAAATTAMEARARARWDRWIGWLHLAARHGGMVVR